MQPPARADTNQPSAYHLIEITAATPPETLAAARELLFEYGYFVRSHSVATFCFGALEEEATQLPISYLCTGGGALLATHSDRPIGFVAWRGLPEFNLTGAWEIKRLWIRPEARGLGLARILMQSIEDRARAAGKSRLLLDTAPNVMAAAVRLYRDLGFTECSAYRGQSHPGILYFQKWL